MYLSVTFLLLLKFLFFRPELVVASLTLKGDSKIIWKFVHKPKKVNEFD